MANMVSDQVMMIYHEVPGGSELVRWFGRVPTFHDAEVHDLDLRRVGESTLHLHGWTMKEEIDHDGFVVLDKHAVVTFRMEGIMDLRLDGFSHQNVIGGLTLQRAADRGRANYYSMPKSPDDIDIELEPSFGLSGFVRAKRVAISFRPGLPDEPAT